MLVSVACLNGNYENVEIANTICLHSNVNISSFEDITTILTDLYSHPDSPYPFIGTTKATKNGFLIPQIENNFIWIFMQNTGNLDLNDFVNTSFSSDSNRIDSLKQFCEKAMQKKISFWKLHDYLVNSRYRSSIEKILSYYVYYVSENLESSQYESWLKASIIECVAPFDKKKIRQSYIGIDLSYFDTCNKLGNILEQRLCTNSRDVSKENQQNIKNLIMWYLNQEKINYNTIVDLAADVKRINKTVANIEHLYKSPSKNKIDF